VPLSKSLSLLALLALPLAAQEPQFGVHGGFTLPAGDLGSTLDHSFGLTVGGHMGFYYSGGHELRPRLELTRFDGGWHPVGDGHFSRSRVSSWTLGADYLYHTDMRPTGPYLLMGLGNSWWQNNTEGRPSATQSSLSVSLGGGFRFDRHWALEGRFTTGSFQDTAGQAHQLQAVASFRF